MRINRTSRAAAAVGVLALALAGCGGDDGDSGDSGEVDGGSEAEAFAEQPIDEIKAAVLADMRDAESVRLSGTFLEDGTETSLDIGISDSGDCAGSMTVEGGTAEIISGPDGTFIKGDEGFWNAAAPGSADQILQVLGDKWALVPQDDTGGLAEFCNLESFIEELEDDEDDDEGEVGETDTIDGREALEIIGQDEDNENATTHVWVAADSPHYILQISSDGETDGGEISFTDYDEPVDTTPPSEDEYVDMTEVG